MDWTRDEIERWTAACEAAQLPGELRWYTADPAADSNELDYEFCRKDAAEGNERAQRYLRAFLVLRMTG
jgi:hypothetical protein